MAGLRQRISPNRRKQAGYRDGRKHRDTRGASDVLEIQFVASHVERSDWL
jgi:hypothetical protein